MKTEPKPAQPEGPLVAHVIGPVDSVARNTIFRLDNGQRWKCIDDGMEQFYEGNNPKVSIRESVSGAHWMTFVGTRVLVRVTRLD